MKASVTGRMFETWPASVPSGHRGSPPFFEKQVPPSVALVLPVNLFSREGSQRRRTLSCVPARVSQAGRPRKGGTCFSHPPLPVIFLDLIFGGLAPSGRDL